MEQKAQSGISKEAIVALLDDASPTVMNALHKELTRMDAEGVAVLAEIIDESHDAVLIAQARQWLKRLGKESSSDIFLDFIYSFNYELETGSLLLDKTIFPELDVNEYYYFMDKISRRCRELMSTPSSARERCKVINRVMFHDYGFTGNSDDYYNPLNSCIHQVALRRRGIPISLSILYILIAERCGLQLEPIALPGHFMVGCFMEGRPFYIDPYYGGVFKTAEEVKGIIVEKINQADEAYLKPASTGAVLCRSCRNLVNQYANENNVDKVALFSGFVRAFEDAYRKHA